MSERIRLHIQAEAEQFAAEAEQFAAKLEQAKAAVARYRDEHGLPADYTSGDADTGSLTEDEEDELRWWHR